MNIPFERRRVDLWARGFTLVELLFVITILAVIAAISVANMRGLADDARTESAKNNARMILATYLAAVEAGANESTDGFSGLATKEEILEALEDGVVGTGKDASKDFQLTGIDPKSRDEAVAFLSYDPVNRSLFFNPRGVLP